MYVVRGDIRDINTRIYFFYSMSLAPSKIFWPLFMSSRTRNFSYTQEAHSKKVNRHICVPRVPFILQALVDILLELHVHD